MLDRPVARKTMKLVGTLLMFALVGKKRWNLSSIPILKLDDGLLK
jgi:hypothetical protein